MIATKIVTLKIENMVDAATVIARPHDDGGILIVEQSEDSVWLDAQGAYELGVFLCDWSATRTIPTTGAA